jgi:hypothetical protein
VGDAQSNAPRWLEWEFVNDTQGLGPADAVVFTDAYLPLAASHPGGGTRIAWLLEPPAVFNDGYAYVEMLLRSSRASKTNLVPFEYVFTFSREMIAFAEETWEAVTTDGSSPQEQQQCSDGAAAASSSHCSADGAAGAVPRFLYVPHCGYSGNRFDVPQLTATLAELKDHNTGLIGRKHRLVSILASGKNSTEGHAVRHDVVYTWGGGPEAYDNSDADANADRRVLDVYGFKYKYVPTTFEAIAPYFFHVVVENSMHDDYFTEKIVDCLSSGAIPIYRGSPSIGKHFNVEGILRFTTMDELDGIMRSLSKELYLSKIDAVLDNLRRSAAYFNAEDWMIEHLPREVVALLEQACEGTSDTATKEKGGEAESAPATVDAAVPAAGTKMDVDAQLHCIPTVPSIVLLAGDGTSINVSGASLSRNTTKVPPPSSLSGGKQQCTCGAEIAPLPTHVVEGILKVCNGAGCCWPSSPVYFGPSVFNGVLPTSTCARLIERVHAYRCSAVCSPPRQSRSVAGGDHGGSSSTALMASLQSNLKTMVYYHDQPMLITVGPNEDPFLRAVDLMPSEPTDVQEKLSSLLQDMQHKAPPSWLKPCAKCSRCGLPSATTYLLSLAAKTQLTAIPEGWSVSEMACEISTSLNNADIMVPVPGRATDRRLGLAQFCYDTAVDFKHCCAQMQRLFTDPMSQVSAGKVAMVEIDTVPQVGLHLWRGQGGEEAAPVAMLELSIDAKRHVLRLGPNDQRMLSAGVFCAMYSLSLDSCKRVLHQLETARQASSSDDKAEKTHGGTLCNGRGWGESETGTARMDECVAFWGQACTGARLQQGDVNLDCDVLVSLLGGMAKADAALTAHTGADGNGISDDGTAAAPVQKVHPETLDV